MRNQICLSLALLAAFALSLAGCSNGGSVASNGALSKPPRPQGNLILSGTIDGTGPRLLALVRRLPSGSKRHTQAAFTFKNILVQGTLYPGDAGDNIVVNSTTIPVPTNGIYSASVSFSNVPVHNNEWGLLQFIGVASYGSQIALGELAGIINVTASPTNSSTLTEATTQTFQVFSMLALNSEIGTNDLDSSATLATTIASDITATGITPDPATHLFDANEMLTLNNDIAPKFERNATVTVSPSVSGSFIFLRDYTNASELDLVSNLANFFQTFTFSVQPPVVGGVLGGGPGSAQSCAYFLAIAPLHSPETNPPPVPSLVTACVIAGSGSTTLRNVYGGRVLIGATNNPYNSFLPPTPPFNGGFLAFAGHAPGTYTATVTTAATQSTIKVTDLPGFAFGATFFASQLPGAGAFFLQPGFGNAPLSATQFSAPTTSMWYRIAVPTPYSSTSNSLIVDTFDPWDIASTKLQICGGINCYALGATQPLAIARPFADAGTKLTFFNWKVGGTATKITQGTGAYNITISGAGTATLTTTTASVLTPRESIEILGTLPFPSTFTVSAKDAASNSYSNSAPVSNPSEVSLTMDSVGNIVTTTSITISFTTISAGTVTIQEIANL